ncbi:hypothetical protein V6N12_001525 [Hibiscus sabdariffa]|uniref:Uncharacterized protein n=1 Tax=Hibiscus sabdariffa TaxID=183260 RepID=A0ABR2BQU7_9ROSI
MEEGDVDSESEIAPPPPPDRTAPARAARAHLAANCKQQQRSPCQLGNPRAFQCCVVRHITRSRSRLLVFIETWFRGIVLPWRNEIRCSFVEQILNKCPALLLQANAQGQTPLHIAARYGDSDVVRILIASRAKASGEDIEQQETALEAVRRMLRKTDRESNTALHVAVQCGHPRVVGELLEFEDPGFSYPVNRSQETPLYIAARRGHRRSLSILLCKLNSAAHGGGPHGRTALHAAAMAGDAVATRMIIEERGDLTKERDKDGQVPLHYAAHLGHYSVVKELLKRDKSGAYVADEKSKMTPLLMAARQGHAGIVREMMACCPDCCEKVDDRGWNLLHFVATRNAPSELVFCCFQDKQGITQHGSVRNLMNAEDEHGITPQQVYYASQPAVISTLAFKDKLHWEKRTRLPSGRPRELQKKVHNIDVALEPNPNGEIMAMDADDGDVVRIDGSLEVGKGANIPTSETVNVSHEKVGVGMSKVSYAHMVAGSA